MDASKALMALGLLRLAAAASGSDTFAQITPSKNLTWHPCYSGFQCAKLDVPLDYQNPGLGRASVPIAKYPAQANSTDGPYKGIILLNPGGPGASGVQEALGNATEIQAIAGTNWDIAGFDTRGTWLSEPLANCSSSLPSNSSSDSMGRRAVPRVSDEFYDSFIDYGKELGPHCQQLIGGPTDAGPHMTTAVTARDMLSIVNAFAATPDGKRAAYNSSLLNYYGISYGTFLGQTFASMFPQRVGHVVVDGVVSPKGYLADDTESAVNHLDGVFGLFFVYCHQAGQKACPFYTGSTARDIFNRFNQSFVQLDARKAAANHWSNASDIENALLVLKDGILAAADSPLSGFSFLPDVLLGLEEALSSGSLSEWTKNTTTIIGDPTVAGYADPEFTLGIVCTDQQNKLYGKNLQDLQPIIKSLECQSILGEIWIHSVLGCTSWSIEAKDVYTGPFAGETANPMLFVSNTFDPITPIENGKSSFPNYKNAQLLTVDGMGHTSSATGNLCAYENIKNYYQNSQLPGKNAFCPLETGPFGITLNGTLAQNLQQAGLTNLH